MPPSTTAGIGVHHRVIVAVSIKVYAVYNFGSEIINTISRYKSADFGIVIPRIQIIKACFFVIVIPAITEGIYICNIICIALYRAFAPCVVAIFGINISTIIIYSKNIPLDIFKIIIIYAVVVKITCDYRFG